MSELLKKAESLQDMLIAHSTNGVGDDVAYRSLRQDLLGEPDLPTFVRDCRNLSQFWGMIKSRFGTYADRRRFIWDAFVPMLSRIEGSAAAPPDAAVADVLSNFGSASVHDVWNRALARRDADPEGAITIARTLLETVCKHILDDRSIAYDDSADLPKLYRNAAQALNLAPDQHTELVFRQILGGCTAVVEGLGSLRNRLSDSHGKRKGAARPTARHAQLAVNLAGAVAMFLVETEATRAKS